MKYSDNFAIVSQNLGYNGSPKSIQPCSGGCIHDATVWEFGDGQRFFVKFSKSSSGRQMLISEYQALKLIRASKTIRCPEPFVAVEVPAEGFVLVMEYLELHRLGNNAAARLGHDLADLHRHTGPFFGFASDNFIGSNAQINTPQADWGTFFWENRIGIQLNLAAKNGYSLGDTGKIEYAVNALLASRTPSMSLLHGDLWGGNAAALADGTPVVYDPASYYGDPETDLAFTEVFGGFPPSFYQAYSEDIGLDSGYPQRKPVYNLYHYLNHLNLFGSSYYSSCSGIIQQLLKQQNLSS